MESRDVLLLTYDALGGKINGKTNLQKKIYFLSVMLNLDLGYGPHYYGPYSASVADANANLKSLGYISESTLSSGACNSQGFEIARHDFALTEEGRIAAAQKKRESPQLWNSIQRGVGALSNAGELNYMELSVAAKSYFILTRAGGRTTLEDIRTFAQRLGWSVSPDDINKAITFLERVGLVRRSAAAGSLPEE